MAIIGVYSTQYVSAHTPAGNGQEEQYNVQVDQSDAIDEDGFDDPENFFDDAPDTLDTSARMSSWQIYLISLAEKLYLIDAFEYGAHACTWLSERARASWAWMKLQVQHAVQRGSDEQNE